MLDPNWTPEAGYSHADALLRILAERDTDETEDGDGELQEV